MRLPRGILCLLLDPHSGLGARSAPKRYCLTRRGLCQDIKGRALDWLPSQFCPHGLGTPAAVSAVDRREAMMRRFVGFVVLAMVPFAAAVGLRAANDPPAWAYAIPPAPPPGAPAPAAAAPDPALRQLPGSTQSFPAAQIRDAFGPADWFKAAAEYFGAMKW